MKPRAYERIFWTPADVTLLESIYPHCHTDDVAAWMGRRVNTVYRAAAVHGLRKTPHYLASLAGDRIQRAHQNPRIIANRFQPGSVPWNKGTHYISGGRSALTRFQPGTINGNAAQLWVPVGSYRINSYGILDRKISELPGRGPRNWEGVHRLVWKKAHGAIPPGHIIAFKPGRKSTQLELITLDAIECISRAQNARRNHPRNKYPELARLVLLKGAITRQVNRIVKQAAEATTA